MFNRMIVYLECEMKSFQERTEIFYVKHETCHFSSKQNFYV